MAGIDAGALANDDRSPERIFALPSDVRPARQLLDADGVPRDSAGFLGNDCLDAGRNRRARQQADGAARRRLGSGSAAGKYATAHDQIERRPPREIDRA